MVQSPNTREERPSMDSPVSSLNFTLKINTMLVIAVWTLPGFHDGWMFGQAYPYPGQFYGQYGNGYNMYNNYAYNGKNNYKGKRNYNNGGYQKQYNNGGGYQKQYNNFQHGGYQANEGYQANYNENYNQVGGGYTNGKICCVVKFDG